MNTNAQQRNRTNTNLAKPLGVVNSSSANQSSNRNQNYLRQPPSSSNGNVTSSTNLGKQGLDRSMYLKPPSIVASQNQAAEKNNTNNSSQNVAKPSGPVRITDENRYNLRAPHGAYELDISPQLSMLGVPFVTKNKKKYENEVDILSLGDGKAKDDKTLGLGLGIKGRYDSFYSGSETENSEFTARIGSVYGGANILAGHTVDTDGAFSGTGINLSKSMGFSLIDLDYKEYAVNKDNPENMAFGGGIDILKGERENSVAVGLDKKGNPTLNASAEAGLYLVDTEAFIEIEGGGVSVKGGLSGKVGVGGDFNVGYEDGVFNVGGGFAWGAGGGASLEIDASGLINQIAPQTPTGKSGSFPMVNMLDLFSPQQLSDMGIHNNEK